MSTNTQEIKWKLHNYKNKKILIWGLKNGLIIPYDDRLIEKLRSIYYGGIPASIILLSDGLCNGHCYDRAVLLSRAFFDEEDDIKLLYARINSLKLNPELAGKNGTGANIKYDCNATTTYNATDITNVTINTDVPLKADNQSFSFENVTFNGNSSEEASNLVEATDQVEGDPIDIRDADITVEDNKVVFSGTVRSDEGASTAKAMYDNKETFTMLLSDFSSGEEKFEEYDCQISSYTADGDNGKVDMTCETPNKNLKNPNAFNFDDSLSISERVVTLHMKEGVSTPVNWEVVSTDTDTTTTTAKTADAVNNISYRKNSSGLSGGAIAGIVIACAVVLIAASIVAMMLRKPAPPLDNTTVVGLKTVDNY